jgi:hypothetical protein
MNDLIDFLQKYIPYELTLIVTAITPLIIVFYRAWIKSKFDKKLEGIKSDHQKEIQKHDIRLIHYKTFYKKVDDLQIEIQKHSESISNEISLKSQEITTSKGFDEALNYENYIENLKKINQIIFDSIQKIQREANEFRFYASDTILIYLDELDVAYNEYLKNLMNQDFGLLQKAFDLMKAGDFNGLLGFMQNPDDSTQQLTMNSNISDLHSKIKEQMRTELNLKK